MLGLSLAETKELTASIMEDTCGSFQERVKALIETKVAEVDRRIEELRSLRNELMQVASEPGYAEALAAENLMECISCLCLDVSAGEGGR